MSREYTDEEYAEAARNLPQVVGRGVGAQPLSDEDEKRLDKVFEKIDAEDAEAAD